MMCAKYSGIIRLMSFILAVATVGIVNAQEPLTATSPGMYWQQSDKFHHDRKWVKPEKELEAEFLGTDGVWHPKPGACWCGVGLNGRWVMPVKNYSSKYVLINGRMFKVDR